MFNTLKKRGIIFAPDFTLFSEAILFEKHHFLRLPWRVIWGQKPGFRPFSRTNRAHKLKGVKTGVIERASANQVVPDATYHHFIIEHVCDDAITIALIVDIVI